MPDDILVEVPAVLLPLQLLDNASGKLVEDGPLLGSLAAQWHGSQICLTEPSFYKHLRGEPADGTSLCLFLCYSAFQIDKRTYLKSPVRERKRE